MPLKIKTMETEIDPNESFMNMILIDLLIFIILIAFFYFMYKVYLHLIKYPEKSQL